VRAVAVALAAMAWLAPAGFARADTVRERFAPPAGFVSDVAGAGSFGAYLQALPLLPSGTPVRTFSGALAYAPWAQAVVDLSVGTRDLQQCADSAIRLRAEWLRASSSSSTNPVRPVFHATSGDPIPYARYVAGERAFAQKNRLGWRPGARAGDDDEVWAAWLETVFLYAGSLSLAKDTTPLTGPIAAGDLLVLGGSPGHVLVILDVARADDGREQWLIGQGFMPAQSFHVIGWYAPDADGTLTVPSWKSPFTRAARRRFR
jgi:hypothetical protein